MDSNPQKKGVYIALYAQLSQHRNFRWCDGGKRKCFYDINIYICTNPQDPGIFEGVFLNHMLEAICAYAPLIGQGQHRLRIRSLQFDVLGSDQLLIFLMVIAVYTELVTLILELADNVIQYFLIWLRYEVRVF